jgi:hypothetical protein
MMMVRMNVVAEFTISVNSELYGNDGGTYESRQRIARIIEQFVGNKQIELADVAFLLESDDPVHVLVRPES